MSRGDRPSRPVLDRLAENSTLLDGCLIWDGFTDKDGYGRIRIGSRKDGSRRVVGVHVWSFEHFHGPVPDGKEVDHRCRVRACWNPPHLQALTHQANSARMVLSEEERAARSARITAYNQRQLVSVR